APPRSSSLIHQVSAAHGLLRGWSTFTASAYSPPQRRLPSHIHRRPKNDEFRRYSQQALEVGKLVEPARRCNESEPGSVLKKSQSWEEPAPLRTARRRNQRPKCCPDNGRAASDRRVEAGFAEEAQNSKRRR